MKTIVMETKPEKEQGVTKAAAKILTQSSRHLKIASTEEPLTDTLERPTSVGFSVEEMARRLGMSISFVYAHVQKDRPVPVRKEGRVHFFSQEYMQALASKPLHPRIRTVEKIAQKRPVIASGEGVLGRLATQEKELAELKNKIVEMTKLLGIS